MRYYIWKRGEKIIAYKQMNSNPPPNAIEVSETEFKSYGFYTPYLPGFSETSSENAIEKNIISGLDSV